jgi:hypothetical protein
MKINCYRVIRSFFSGSQGDLLCDAFQQKSIATFFISVLTIEMQTGEHGTQVSLLSHTIAVDCIFVLCELLPSDPSVKRLQ